jgi:hypothetical protein
MPVAAAFYFSNFLPPQLGCYCEVLNISDIPNFAITNINEVRSIPVRRQEKTMKTIFLAIVCLISASTICHSEEKRITLLQTFEIEKSQPRGLQENNRINVLCIDGYKFVSSYGWSAWSGQTGVGTGAGVSLVQFYEERDGKAIPARCDSKSN